MKPVGRRGDGVAVRHPDPVRGRDVGQQGAGLPDRDVGAAVLAGAGVRDLAAEAPGHQLEAVAHAEDRGAGREDGGVDGGRVLGVHRGRTAGEDDRLRLAGEHLLDRHVVRHDLGVDPGLAHTARDQLGVLGAEVDDQDQVMVGLLRHARSLSTAPGPRTHQDPAGREGGRVLIVHATVEQRWTGRPGDGGSNSNRVSAASTNPSDRGYGV